MQHVPYNKNYHLLFPKRENWIQMRYLLFASDLSQMVKHIDDVSYSSRGFLNLGGQVDASHGNNLERR